MKQFSIFHIPVLSFYSKALYRDVAMQWKGVGFAYLLLLLAVCWIPNMIIVHMGFSHFVESKAPALVEQVPKLTIVDGVVSIDQPQPYYITDPDSNDVLVIIDTTGTTTSLEDPNTFCLVTKTKVVWRQSKFETRTFDLSQVKNFVLDSDRITGWLDTAGKFLVIAIYPFALLGSYVYRIVQVLIYAAIGLLFASWCKVMLSYAALLRLAVVAVTPCVLLKTMLGLAGVHLPYAWLIYLLIALAYLFFAVKAVSEPLLVDQEDEFPEQPKL